jgi:hypothetical protein
MKRSFAGALLFLLVLSAGQGGYGENAKGAPDLAVSPSKHDFGVLGVPLESKTRVFTISNTGAAALVVSGIVLSDTANYSLEADAGPDPCGSVTPRIVPGGHCTFAVTFYPQSQGILDASITVLSNDPDTPRMSVPLKGFGLLCYC